MHGVMSKNSSKKQSVKGSGNNGAVVKPDTPPAPVIIKQADAEATLTMIMDKLDEISGTEVDTDRGGNNSMSVTLQKVDDVVSAFSLNVVGLLPDPTVAAEQEVEPGLPITAPETEEEIKVREDFEKLKASFHSELLNFKTVLVAEVTKCLDENLAQTRMALLHHRKKIQSKLWMTRESLALSNQAQNNATTHMREEEVRIVRTTLEERNSRNMEAKQEEIRTLEYNNRILNQKITEALEESKANMTLVADLKLQLAPFLKETKKKGGRRMSKMSSGGMHMGDPRRPPSYGSGMGSRTPGGSSSAITPSSRGTPGVRTMSAPGEGIQEFDQETEDESRYPSPTQFSPSAQPSGLGCAQCRSLTEEVGRLQAQLVELQAGASSRSPYGSPGSGHRKQPAGNTLMRGQTPDAQVHSRPSSGHHEHHHQDQRSRPDSGHRSLQRQDVPAGGSRAASPVGSSVVPNTHSGEHHKQHSGGHHHHHSTHSGEHHQQHSTHSGEHHQQHSTHSGEHHHHHSVHSGGHHHQHHHPHSMHSGEHHNHHSTHSGGQHHQHHSVHSGEHHAQEAPVAVQPPDPGPVPDSAPSPHHIVSRSGSNSPTAQHLSPRAGPAVAVEAHFFPAPASMTDHTPTSSPEARAAGSSGGAALSTMPHSEAHEAAVRAYVPMQPRPAQAAPAPILLVVEPSGEKAQVVTLSQAGAGDDSSVGSTKSKVVLLSPELQPHEPGQGAQSNVVGVGSRTTSQDVSQSGSPHSSVHSQALTPQSRHDPSTGAQVNFRPIDSDDRSVQSNVSYGSVGSASTGSYSRSHSYSASQPSYAESNNTLFELRKQQNENEVLIRLLHEGKLVQQELEGVVLNLEVQNRDLLDKIKGAEEEAVMNKNIYKLQLKERGLLLRELSMEVNNLRQTMHRERAMKERSRVKLGGAGVGEAADSSGNEQGTVGKAQLQAQVALGRAELGFQPPLEPLHPPSVSPHNDTLRLARGDDVEARPGSSSGVKWTPKPSVTDQGPGLRLLGGGRGVGSVSAPSLQAQLSASLPVGCTAAPNMRSLFEASGGAFGSVDLKKQQDELDYQQAMLKLPWHKRLELITQMKQKEEAQIQQQLLRQQREEARREQLRQGGASPIRSTEPPDINSVTNELLSPLLANVDTRTLLPELREGRKKDLKDIRGQIAAILAENIAPKRASQLAVTAAVREKMEKRKMFAVKAAKSKFGGELGEEKDDPKPRTVYNMPKRRSGVPEKGAVKYDSDDD